MNATEPNTDTSPSIANTLKGSTAIGVTGGMASPGGGLIPPIVGQPPTLYTPATSIVTPTHRSLKPIPLLSCQAQRFISWTQCWRSSPWPDPNIHLICKFSDEEMAFSRKRGESASALRETAFNSIAHLYRRKKFPWLSVWTMESHHGIHVHALLWAPEGRKFRSQLAVLLIDRFRMPWDPWATPWEQISRQNSNAPVCIVPINDDRGFKRVGKWGLDGVIDYVAKDIDSNVDSRIVSKRLGKITGATKLILDIRKARAVPRPRTIKISSSPAGGARP